MVTAQIVRDILAREVMDFDPEGVEDTTDFKDLDIDSMDHATILLVLEEEHGLIVPDEDVELCNSIHAIVEYAAGKKAASAAT